MEDEKKSDDNNKTEDEKKSNNNRIIEYLHRIYGFLNNEDSEDEDYNDYLKNNYGIE